MTKLIAEHDVSLQVPFAEKEAVKKIQGRNWTGKVWQCKQGFDLVPFKQWLPDPYLSQVREILGEEQVKGMTLFQLQSTVRDTLAKHMGDRYWVRAEVLHTQSKGHLYLELSDYDDSGSTKAKARAMIWSNSLSIVREFEAQTCVKLSAGLKVLVNTTVEYHPQYGLSLHIHQIDHAFSVGDMEMRLNKIRETLLKEGVFEANQRLRPPTEFTRVAVIAPGDAAGLGDFRTQADLLHSHRVCQFDYYPVVYQGPQMLAQMAAAFAKIETVRDQYDCIVMIRGGGDKQGLYELNQEALIRTICTASLPVFVGIGHQRDVTLLDEVANNRFPTPSMVIGHIAGTIVANAKRVRECLKSIRHSGACLISEARMNNHRLMTGLKMSATTQVNAERQAINDLKFSLRANIKKVIAINRHNIEMNVKTVLLQSPHNVLNKGYTIVKDSEGKAVTSAEQATTQTQVTVMFKDGEVDFKKD